MDKFRVGQKVRCVNLYRDVEDNGNIYFVIERRCVRRFSDGDICAGYKLDDGFYVKEKNLEPVYDGEVKSSWSESVWKPKELIKE